MSWKEIKEFEVVPEQDKKRIPRNDWPMEKCYQYYRNLEKLTGNTVRKPETK